MRQFFLRTAVLFAFIFTFSFQAEAQFKIGPGIALSTGGLQTYFGIEVKSEIHFTESIALGADFVFFFPKNGITFLNLDADAHYHFGVSDDLTVYPLVGLSVLIASGGFGGSATDIGLNIGGGAHYGISDRLTAFVEPKYTIGGGGIFVLQAGVLFTLGGG